MVASYQEKLDSVTNNYEEKVNILEGRLAERDIDSMPSSPMKAGPVGMMPFSNGRDYHTGK